MSDEGLYVNNGFVHSGELKPDYSYIVNNARVYSMTEKELAKMNNLLKIYDCGKTRFVKILVSAKNSVEQNEEKE